MKNIPNSEKPPETPVYLFTGFLESGKTTFINQTLCDERFNTGERTLVLLCEEGLEELLTENFICPDIFVKALESEDDLNSKNLSRLQNECRADRIFVEFNGMWTLDALYTAMPRNWTVYQEFMFADSSSFLSYNKNMRSLVFDKLQSCELVVFNRCTALTDEMALHKIVRAVNRKCDIAYENTDRKVHFDEIEDPLPFDISAPVIKISDDDFAVWYRDLGEELQKYDGKTVSFKAMISTDAKIPNGCFVIGRPLLNCCADDISLAGLIAVGTLPETVENGDWVQLCAEIEIKEHEAYEKKGPVLKALSIELAKEPENPVASF